MNFNATTIVDAKLGYLETRYKELASRGIEVYEEINHEDCAIITYYFNKDNNYNLVMSIYILEQYRNQGLYLNLYNYYKDYKYGYQNTPIVTMPDCSIVGYLKKHNIPFILVEPSFAYLKIRNFYGDKTTKRSSVKLINHIDEGLSILNSIKSNQETLDAYCLHPMLQSDDDFNNNIGLNYGGISTKALLLAVEYRRVANSYLSTMKISDFVGFTNNEIKDMLYADKVQNEKDFKLYHEGIHGRSKELREYFNNWLNILLKDYKENGL